MDEDDALFFGELEGVFQGLFIDGFPVREVALVVEGLAELGLVSGVGQIVRREVLVEQYSAFGPSSTICPPLQMMVESD